MSRPLYFPWAAGAVPGRVDLFCTRVELAFSGAELTPINRALALQWR
jgi:hypothetical protein